MREIRRRLRAARDHHRDDDDDAEEDRAECGGEDEPLRAYALEVFALDDGEELTHVRSSPARRRSRPPCRGRCGAATAARARIARPQLLRPRAGARGAAGWRWVRARSPRSDWSRRAFVRASGRRRCRSTDGERSSPRATAMYWPPCSAFTAAMLPSSTFSPCAMMHTASQMRSAFSIRCVLKITVRPSRRRSTIVSLSACAFIGSRPLNGSSRMIEVGLVQERADELDLLLHAARELLDARVPPVLSAAREREPLEPALDAAVCLAPAYALERGEKAKDAAHLHLLVETALFREITDAIADRDRRCSSVRRSRSCRHPAR